MRDGTLLADRLRAGAPLSGLIVKMPSPAQVESAGHAGFDFVVLDTEHGPSGGIELEQHLRAAAAVGLPALVRVPSSEPPAILAALDAGATGVVVPHVLDAAGAAAAVAAAHYPPRGRRGLATSTRAGSYGAVPLAEHLSRAAAETCIVVQIEDAEAVPLAGEILAADGVTAVLIGAADLALSLGRPGAPHHPDVEAALDRVLDAAAQAQVPVLGVASPELEAATWHARGVAAIVSVSTALVHAAFVEAARAAGSSAAPLPGREPVVLLPGMLGDARLWDGVLPLLAEHCAPQFGRIDRDDSVPGMAETVLAAAPDRFALVGHSLGGIVALEIARRAPQRVSRLALLNASARPASDPQLQTWGTMRERTEAGDFPAVAREFATANLPERRRGDTALAARVEAMALSVGAPAFLMQLAAQRSRPDSRPSLGTIRCPTVVVTGHEDEICPEELQRELADGIPGADRALVDGAGHLAALERPQAVAECLAAWLER